MSPVYIVIVNNFERPAAFYPLLGVHPIFLTRVCLISQVQHVNQLRQFIISTQEAIPPIPSRRTADVATTYR